MATARQQAAAALYLVDHPAPREAPKERETVEVVGLPDLQDGPQSVAGNSTADIIFYGGSAGGGKTFWLEWEAAVHKDNPQHRAVLLRRTKAQARKQGALCDTTSDMYRPLGSSCGDNGALHEFPSGAVIEISGCEREKDRYAFDGAQFSMIGFDQVEQFTGSQFWYIALSRSRTMADISTRICATANPVNPKDKVGGWLAKFLMEGGWVDSQTGDAIEEMSGVVRWLWRKESGDGFTFWESFEEAMMNRPRGVSPRSKPKSVTFVRAKLEDNQILLEKDPNYESNLDMLARVDRRRQKDGNWLISSEGGGHIKREWIRMVDDDPQWNRHAGRANASVYRKECRGWDLAGTDKEEDGKQAKDRTAAVKLGQMNVGEIVIRDCRAGHWSPAEIVRQICRAIVDDGPLVKQRFAQDPAQAGKFQVHALRQAIMEYCAENRLQVPPIEFVTVQKKKLDRGLPFARQCEPMQESKSAAGTVKIYGSVVGVRTPDVEDCIDELHQFDGSEGSPDDYWDAAADAYLGLLTAPEQSNNVEDWVS